ncbi:hypothetical protein AAES_78864 [Amazona aestiva]|uniref:Uncharacterized protein n=1 Tax=Amazona aestiva TaxID=12930 RepID=A0A0Q3USU7_AMAAE|nr:hypothetical protein AAES_78864 [Amazona aestiva]
MDVYKRVQYIPALLDRMKQANKNNPVTLYETAKAVDIGLPAIFSCSVSESPIANESMTCEAEGLSETMCCGTQEQLEEGVASGVALEI